jgi:hypothetical protein
MPVLTGNDLSAPAFLFAGRIHACKAGSRFTNGAGNSAKNTRFSSYQKKNSQNEKYEENVALLFFGIHLIGCENFSALANFFTAARSFCQMVRLKHRKRCKSTCMRRQ